jgi:hypothetical protein
MTFKLDDAPPDLAATLRELEAEERKLSPRARALLVLSATMLESQRSLLEDAAKELEEAAGLKIGMMDSQSRADDVSRQVRATLVTLATRIRILLGAPVQLPPAKPDNAAVI